MSQAQLAANRANAQKSTGPSSELGRDISSQNRITHGLTAQRIVLLNESQAEFDELLASFRTDYNPESETEKQLVQDLTEQTWRLKRATRYETRLLDAAGDDFQAVSKDLDNLRRYRTAIERAFHKAIDQLRRIASDRAKAEATKAARAELKKQLFHKALGDIMDIMMNAPLPGQIGFDPQTGLETQPISIVDAAKEMFRQREEAKLAE